MSFVRSVQMDSWTEREITSMRVGGNKNLNDFFDKYNILSVSEVCEVSEVLRTCSATLYKMGFKGLAPSETPHFSLLTSHYNNLSGTAR